MIPKGKLIAIGGNVDKGTDSESIYKRNRNLHFFEFQILKRFLEELHTENPRIEVITTASRIPEEVGDTYLKAFEEIGNTNVGVLHIKKKKDVKNTEYIQRIRNCDGVLFTGGDQYRLSTIFGGSEILDILHERYQHDNFIIAGTSAGAMAMSHDMIRRGSSSEALIKGQVQMARGFGFLQEVYIDSHFVKRGRFGRLAQAVASNPAYLGLGLGEDTGVLIEEGNKMEVIGSGLVIIFDGHQMRHTNVAEIQEGTPMAIENLVVHVLVQGNHFNLNERKFFAELEKA